MRLPENSEASPPQSISSQGGYVPYSDYKDSGIEWLGEIPVHWEVRQLGQIGTFEKCNGGTKEDESSDGLPCVRYGDIYTHHDFFVRQCCSHISPESAINYTPIRYGDILFAGSGETLDEIAKSAVNLIDTEVYCGGDVILLRVNIEADAHFMGYAVGSPQAAHQKSLMGRGITVMHIYGSQLKRLAVAIPPIEEQQAIATHLDHETAKIDTLIKKQEQLIDLLKERRTALISHAVTKGLNPTVSMKDSGIEWLGEIPAHWGVTAAKRQFTVQLGKMLQRRPVSQHDIEVPYLKARHVQWFAVDASSLPTMWAHERECEKYHVQKGDLVVCEGGEGGRCGIVQDVPQNCIIQNALHRVREDQSGESRIGYLQYVIRAVSSAEWLEVTNSKATIAHFTKDKFDELLVPIPPHAEQQSIAEFLDRETAKIDTLISKIHQIIELQKESRSALITAAVTGKMDVRQASIPSA